MKTYELAFDDFRIPAASLMGEEGKGFYLITSELEKARAHTAARAIGCASGALDTAIAYAKQRVQFGKPVSDFQGIRFKLAKMATEIEAARQLMYYVCDCVDTGRRSDKEASMVKYSPARWRSASPRTRCRFSAALATPNCIRSSDSGATHG